MLSSSGSDIKKEQLISLHNMFVASKKSNIHKQEKDKYGIQKRSG